MCSYIYHFRELSHVNMRIYVHTHSISEQNRISMCMFVLKQNLSELHYVGIGIHVCTGMFLITVTLGIIGTYVTCVI